MSEWQYDQDNGNVMCRCPECGGVHVFCYENLGWTGNSAQVVCPDCGASSKMIFDNSAKKARNEAVKRWNLRAQT